MYNIIGDIAGNIKTLKALLSKMPDGEVLSVGDMIDRGPSSNEVIEFIKNNGHAILGNHEDMMIDYAEGTNSYRKGIWLYNGGDETLKSYGGNIDMSHVAWLKSLENVFYINDEFGSVVVTHAPINPVLGLEKANERCSDREGGRDSLYWNRGKPRRHSIYDYQIFGHSSFKRVKEFKDIRGIFAYGIDTSHVGKLSGIHWPSLEVFEQEVID